MTEKEEFEFDEKIVGNGDDEESEDDGEEPRTFERGFKAEA